MTAADRRIYCDNLGPWWVPNADASKLAGVPVRDVVRALPPTTGPFCAEAINARRAHAELVDAALDSARAPAGDNAVERIKRLGVMLDEGDSAVRATVDAVERDLWALLPNDVKAVSKNPAEAIGHLLRWREAQSKREQAAEQVGMTRAAEAIAAAMGLGPFHTPHLEPADVVELVRSNVKDMHDAVTARGDQLDAIDLALDERGAPEADTLLARVQALATMAFTIDGEPMSAACAAAIVQRDDALAEVSALKRLLEAKPQSMQEVLGILRDAGDQLMLIAGELLDAERIDEAEHDAIAKADPGEALAKVVGPVQALLEDYACARERTTTSTTTSGGVEHDGAVSTGSAADVVTPASAPCVEDSSEDRVAPSGVETPAETPGSGQLPVDVDDYVIRRTNSRPGPPHHVYFAGLLGDQEHVGGASVFRGRADAEKHKPRGWKVIELGLARLEHKPKAGKAAAE